MLRRQLVIIEGPNGCGKTTFVRRIEELYPGHTCIVHWRSQTPHHYEYAFQAARFLIEAEVLVVWDRSWLSNLVYARLGSNTLEYSDKDLRRFHRVPALRIVVVPPARLRHDDATDPHEKDYELERMAYLDEARRWGWNVIDRYYDTDEVAREVVDFMTCRRDVVSSIVTLPSRPSSRT
jgi:thymidylate kinase